MGGYKDGEGDQLRGPEQGSCNTRSEGLGCHGLGQGRRGRKRKVSAQDAKAMSRAKSMHKRWVR
jgi:hypothetical protein